jgi:hypothetical protein
MRHLYKILPFIIASLLLSSCMGTKEAAGTNPGEEQVTVVGDVQAKLTTDKGTSIDLGVFVLETPNDFKLTLKNTGLLPASSIYVDPQQFEGTPFSFAGKDGEYPGTEGDCTNYIAGDHAGSCTLHFDFFGTEVGNYNQSFTIKFFDGLMEAEQTFSFSVYAGLAAEIIVLGEIEVNLGVTGPESTVEAEITFQNVGSLWAEDVTGVILSSGVPEMDIYEFKGGTFPGTGGTCGQNGGRLEVGETCTIMVEATTPSQEPNEVKEYLQKVELQFMNPINPGVFQVQMRLKALVGQAFVENYSAFGNNFGATYNHFTSDPLKVMNWSFLNIGFVGAKQFKMVNPDNFPLKFSYVDCPVDPASILLADDAIVIPKDELGTGEICMMKADFYPNYDDQTTTFPVEFPSSEITWTYDDQKTVDEFGIYIPQTAGVTYMTGESYTDAYLAFYKKAEIDQMYMVDEFATDTAGLWDGQGTATTMGDFEKIIGDWMEIYQDIRIENKGIAGQRIDATSIRYEILDFDGGIWLEETELDPSNFDSPMIKKASGTLANLGVGEGVNMAIHFDPVFRDLVFEKDGQTYGAHEYDHVKDEPGITVSGAYIPTDQLEDVKDRKIKFTYFNGRIEKTFTLTVRSKAHKIPLLGTYSPNQPYTVKSEPGKIFPGQYEDPNEDYSAFGLRRNPGQLIEFTGQGFSLPKGEGVAGPIIEGPGVVYSTYHKTDPALGFNQIRVGNDFTLYDPTWIPADSHRPAEGSIIPVAYQGILPDMSMRLRFFIRNFGVTPITIGGNNDGTYNFENIIQGRRGAFPEPLAIDRSNLLINTQNGWYQFIDGTGGQGCIGKTIQRTDTFTDGYCYFDVLFHKNDPATNGVDANWIPDAGDHHGGALRDEGYFIDENGDERLAPLCNPLDVTPKDVVRRDNNGNIVETYHTETATQAKTRNADCRAMTLYFDNNLDHTHKLYRWAEFQMSFALKHPGRLTVAKNDEVFDMGPVAAVPYDPTNPTIYATKNVGDLEFNYPGRCNEINAYDCYSGSPVAGDYDGQIVFHNSGGWPITNMIINDVSGEHGTDPFIDTTPDAGFYFSSTTKDGGDTVLTENNQTGMMIKAQSLVVIGSGFGYNSHHSDHRDEATYDLDDQFYSADFNYFWNYDYYTNTTDPLNLESVANYAPAGVSTDPTVTIQATDRREPFIRFSNDESLYEFDRIFPGYGPTLVPGTPTLWKDGTGTEVHYGYLTFRNYGQISMQELRSEMAALGQTWPNISSPVEEDKWIKVEIDTTDPALEHFQFTGDFEGDCTVHQIYDKNQPPSPTNDPLLAYIDITPGGYCKLHIKFELPLDTYGGTSAPFNAYYYKSVHEDPFKTISDKLNDDGSAPLPMTLTGFGLFTADLVWSPNTDPFVSYGELLVTNKKSYMFELSHIIPDSVPASDISIELVGLGADATCPTVPRSKLPGAWQSYPYHDATEENINATKDIDTYGVAATSPPTMNIDEANSTCFTGSVTDMDYNQKCNVKIDFVPRRLEYVEGACLKVTYKAYPYDTVPDYKVVTLLGVGTAPKITHKGWYEMKTEGARDGVEKYVLSKWRPMEVEKNENGEEIAKIMGYHVYRKKVTTDTFTGTPINDPMLMVADEANKEIARDGVEIFKYLDEESLVLEDGKGYNYYVEPWLDVVHNTGLWKGDIIGGTHEQRIVIPFQNMTLLHRDSVNIRICMEYLNFAYENLDMNNHYRCFYSGPGNNDGYFDIDTDLMIDRFENGLDLEGNLSNAAGLPPHIFDRIDTVDDTKGAANACAEIPAIDMPDLGLSGLRKRMPSKMEMSIASYKAFDNRDGCNLSGTSYKPSGRPEATTGCASYYGVEDTIGNAWEWVSDRMTKDNNSGLWAYNSDSDLYGYFWFQNIPDLDVELPETYFDQAPLSLGTTACLSEIFNLPMRKIAGYCPEGSKAFDLVKDKTDTTIDEYYISQFNDAWDPFDEAVAEGGIIFSRDRQMMVGGSYYSNVDFPIENSTDIDKAIRPHIWATRIVQPFLVYALSQNGLEDYEGGAVRCLYELPYKDD